VSTRWAAVGDAQEIAAGRDGEPVVGRLPTASCDEVGRGEVVSGESRGIPGLRPRRPFGKHDAAHPVREDGTCAASSADARPGFDAGVGAASPRATDAGRVL